MNTVSHDTFCTSLWFGWLKLEVESVLQVIGFLSYMLCLKKTTVCNGKCSITSHILGFLLSNTGKLLIIAMLEFTKCVSE